METIYFSKRYNKKVICFQDLYNKMNDMQRSYIIFVQNPAKPNEVHVRANSWFYISFAKGKATNSIIRCSGLLRKFKIIDSQLAPLKQKYIDFVLTWFWEFKTKITCRSWFAAQWLQDETSLHTMMSQHIVSTR